MIRTHCDLVPAATAAARTVAREPRRTEVRRPANEGADGDHGSPSVRFGIKHRVKNDRHHHVSRDSAGDSLPPSRTGQLPRR